MHDAELTLDPSDWDSFRVQAHSALDMMIDYLRGVRDEPVWRPIPDPVVQRLSAEPPEEPEGLERALRDFQSDILPYPSGNLHPRFWSWVAGNGSPTGMVADMLASGLNALTIGFDDSAATRVDLQVLDWFKRLFRFPPESSGLFVSGSSMATIVALAVARTAKAGYDVRTHGVGRERSLLVYGSTETHNSVHKGVELLGLGNAHLRSIPTNAAFEIQIDSLVRAIETDAAHGRRPAILIANAGTVNTGAIDPLNAMADLASEYDLWLHVDGAFGSMATLTREPPSNLAGLEMADSLAFDLHKWLHQPYAVGCVLVRHPTLHRDTFTAEPAYLEVPDGGLAAGPINFSAFGVQHSRSFTALRPWLSFKTHGLRVFRELIEQNISQARYLDGLIRDTEYLELLAPTSLNIVNYRFNPGWIEESALDALNRRILVELQEQGIAGPSSTRIGEAGRFSIRVCITNHRSRLEDFRHLVDASVRIGLELLRDAPQDGSA